METVKLALMNFLYIFSYFPRWNLLFQIANGVDSRNVDIFLRDWNIRNELMHKAHFYTVGIRSAHIVSTVVYSTFLG